MLSGVRVENGKKALVLGCGASGAAAARFLFRRGWSVTVADTRENPPQAQALTEEGIAFSGGGLKEELLTEATDLLVMSPGLSLEHSAAAPLVAKARRLGIDIAGEIELFARELKRLAAFRHYRPKVIAVTGTNGKTTTTSLVGQMVRACGLSACVAGNIGPNAVAELDRLLIANELPDVWVLELSSFQLETTTSLEPVSAAFLNLTEDHIDWHGSIEAYAAAKAKIFADATHRVLNAEDPRVMACADGVSAQCVDVFADADPQNPGEWGITNEAGIEWLSVIRQSAPVGTGKAAQLAAEPIEKTLLMPVDALQIRGRHNAMNALAALALVANAGLRLAPALKALKNFKGEAHRVQPVLSIGAVEFIDDSKGTNVGATMAALEGLGKSGRKSAVILGGDAKGQNFAPISETLKKYALFAVLIGRDAPFIRPALEEAGVAFEEAGTDFDRAVDLAWEAAKNAVDSGAVKEAAVLLSPACASWDMFKDYAERSSRFIARAQAIAESVGNASELQSEMPENNEVKDSKNTSEESA